MATKRTTHRRRRAFLRAAGRIAVKALSQLIAAVIQALVTRYLG